MNNLIRRAKAIRNLAIVCAVAIILNIVLTVVTVMLSSKDIHVEYNGDYYGTPTTDLVPFTFWSVSFITGTVAVICSFISSLMILATSWNNPILDRDKILWGLLGLFLLGWISGLVFGIKALNIFKSIKAKQEASKIETPSSFQPPIYPKDADPDRITMM